MTKEQRKRFKRIMQEIGDFCYENNLDVAVFYDNRGKFNHFRIRFQKKRKEKK
jgi:hypothetical protein